MRTTDLEWQLDVPAWSHQGRPFRVKPTQVAADPSTYPEQYQRALGADLSRPLVVTQWKRKWTILDGLHRLLKARINALEEVTVQRLSRADWTAVEV
jgi:hypothetical protein